MNNVYLSYAISADPQLRRAAVLTQMLIYYAARGGTDGVAWCSTRDITTQTGIASRHISRYRARGEALGYLIPAGYVRRARKYQLGLPDRDGIPEAVIRATTRCPAERHRDLPAAVRALATPSRSILASIELYRRLEKVIGAERALARWAELQHSHDRPHQIWRCWVADVLRASGNAHTQGDMYPPTEGKIIPLHGEK